MTKLLTFKHGHLVILTCRKCLHSTAKLLSVKKNENCQYCRNKINWKFRHCMNRALERRC